MPVAERGRLGDVPLPQLLVELDRQGFTGSLALRRERTSKRFLLCDGSPVHSESSLASESLLAQLAKAGAISAADRSRAEEQIRRSGASDERVLLEQRLLDTRQLFFALREQVRLRLLECFAWPDGEFELDASEAPAADSAALKVDLLPLVQDGIASHWSAERVLTGLGPRMNAYPRRSDRMPKLVERLRPDPEVSTLLERLDGSSTLWQALQAAPGPRAMATAWLLDAVGALRFSDAAGNEAVGPPSIELVVMEQAKRVRPERIAHSAGRSARRLGSQRDAEALRREVAQTYARLHELDHYQLLGLDAHDDSEAVKRAYLLAAKTYHPDAVARSGLDPEACAQANRVFATIGKAYAILSDAERRRDYDRSLSGDDSAIDAERLANAETLYRKGEVLLRLGNFSGALEFLAPAVDLWPEEADYQSALGWALYKKTPADPETARAHLTLAAEMKPDDSVALFRLSVVLRALGESDGSEQMMGETRQVDPERG